MFWREWEESLHHLLLLLLPYREYGSIDGVDVDLHINADFLDVRKTVTR